MVQSQTSRPENGILAHVDAYLLFLRWVAVGAAIPLSVLDTISGDMWLSFPLALGVVIGLNLVLSIYGMRQRAFAAGRASLILTADAAQAGLVTLLAGGYHSTFFPLFVLLVVELAVALPTRLASAWILSAGALHVASVVLNQAGDWTALGAYMTVAKLLTLMIIGTLALAFSEQIRRAESSRWATETYAAQLKALNEQYRQFEQARQSFLSAIAHELRTPLTVLKTLLPALGSWDVAPATRQEIQAMVEQNLGRLESLTSDFLESTRLETGAVRLHRQFIDPAQRAQRVLNTLKPLFLSKQQQISLDLLSPIPRVWADRRRVDQVLSSLLHNAYKFTPAGGAIRAVVQADDQAVRLSIEDNGPGVPPAAQEHIFNKFYSAPVESALAGVGLGLYICRALVSLHGGDLWYEGRPEGGSRFCFTLPLKGGENDAESDAEDPYH